MDCPQCSAKTVPGQKFCMECGASLSTPCPQCGTPVAPGAKFCGECGESLDAEPEPAREPTPERRLVSVLFADIVGYTSIAEGRDPEEVRDFLTRYFDLARTTIRRYGGTVDKFIGDAVMGVWGSPIAHEDDAERAVRAGLDLAPAVERMAADAGFADLRVRVGVATGEAAVLIDVADQGMVAGDLVNTASRIEGAAEPGTVLVNEATYRASRRSISYEPGGTLDLKGKSEQVQVWRPLQIIARRGGEGREALEGPFVGRSSELQLLKDLFAATTRDGRAHLVTVMGIGGIGKSRLVAELGKYLDGLVGTTYWHQGRSPSYGDGITFWALGEMVRRRAGITEGDDVETTIARLRDAVDRFVPEQERDGVRRSLEILLGVRDAAGTEPEVLYQGWRRFFESVAADHPTVLVFEDLQWADAGLLDFVESLTIWSRHVPLYIIALARPELMERRPSWGAGWRSYTGLHLEPLAPEEMRDLLRGLVPGIPDEAMERVVERAEGIPLYAVETVRMLIDRGNLTETDDGYLLAGELGTLAVPETLHALVASRLDSLDPDDRRLVQRASVLGQAFSAESLTAVTDSGADAVETRLRRLVDRRVLDVQTDPRSPERGQYTFVQAVVREVALGTLSRTDRRELHVRVADHLEAQEDDELLPAVAHHLLEAIATQDAAGSTELSARAARILEGAAARAGDLGSREQELSLLEQALQLGVAPNDAARISEGAATAAIFAGLTARAEPYLRSALDHHRSSGSVEDEARVAAKLARAISLEGRIGEAEEIVESVLDRAADLNPKEIGRLESERARMRLYAQDAEEGSKAVERALSAAAEVGDVRTIVDTMVTKAWALMLLGRNLESVGVNLGAIELAMEHDVVEAEFRARNNIGAAFAIDAHRIERIATEGIERARALGNLDMLTLMYVKAIDAAMSLGEWDRAAELIDAPEMETASTFNRNQAELFEVSLYSARGDLERANDARVRLTERLEDAETGQDRFMAHWANAIFEEARGDFTEAISEYELALKEFDWGAPIRADVARVALAAGDLGHARRRVSDLEGMAGLPRSWQGQRDWIAGSLAIRDGDTEGGLARAMRGVDTLRDLGEIPEVGLALFELAVALPSDHPRREVFRAEAIAIAERLGAAGLLAVHLPRLD